ncbi:MAG: DUF5777 family beta-barrel protein [Saprospiraceae bacterium]|nr:DUF5777 family beta-barrel protein [Saprospiraceae bacterium]
MRLILTLPFFLLAIALSAQDEPDLLSLVEEKPETEYATASFKSTKVVNGQSVENLAAGVLDFRIAHRFGTLNEGLYDMFGLDAATTRLSLDYGVTSRLQVGIGRSTYQKTVDGNLKYKILRQSSGQKNMPVTLSYYTDMQINTLKWSDPERENLASSRYAFTHQLLLARKFNESLTFQFMPTLVHRNLVPSEEDKNDVFALGFAGRVKLTKRVAITAEYYYVLPDQIVSTPYANSLAIGFDIETGGHVFQLHFTNAQAMTYNGIICDTPLDWFYEGENGNTMTGIRFGFNLSRVFTIVKPKGYTEF